VQVRRPRRSVAGRTDVAEQVAAAQAHPFAQAVGVAIEVGVVVGKPPSRVELIDGEPAGHAGKELHEPAVVDCEDLRSPGRRDVDRLVPMTAPPVGEGVAQCGRGHALHRHRELARREQRVTFANHIDIGSLQPG
jgi:hypothetical protein